MVILLESTHNLAMKLADPYASSRTSWYHVIWGTQGIQIPPRSGPRVRRGRGAGGYCDPSLRDRPARTRTAPEKPISIPNATRPALACAICDVCARRQLAIRCLSISATHVHALMKLDAEEDLARATIEDCKRISCLLACTDRTEGLWAKGCELLPVRSELHFDRVSQLICHDREGDTYLWKHPRLMRAEEEKRDRRETA